MHVGLGYHVDGAFMPSANQLRPFFSVSNQKGAEQVEEGFSERIGCERCTLSALPTVPRRCGIGAVMPIHMPVHV